MPSAEASSLAPMVVELCHDGRCVEARADRGYLSRDGRTISAGRTTLMANGREIRCDNFRLDFGGSELLCDNRRTGEASFAIDANLNRRDFL